MDKEFEVIKDMYRYIIIDDAFNSFGSDAEMNKKIAKAHLDALEAIEDVGNEGEQKKTAAPAAVVAGGIIPALATLSTGLMGAATATSAIAGPTVGSSFGGVAGELGTQLNEDYSKIELLKSRIRNKYELARDIDARIRALGINPQYIMDYIEKNKK